MQIGSIGAGIGMGGASLGGGFQAGGITLAGQGAVSGIASPDGSPVQSPQTLVSASATFRMQALTETLRDFSSAEILMALMMMNAGKKDDDKSSGGSAALGLLAGMALATQLGKGNGLDGLAYNPMHSISASLDIGFNVDVRA